MWISIPAIVLALFLMSRMMGAEYGVLGITEMPELFHYIATRILLPLFSTFIIFTVGRKYLRAIRTYIRYGKATMDTLVGIGTSFAYFFSIFVTLFSAGLALDIVQLFSLSSPIGAWLATFQQNISAYIDPARVFYEAVIIVIGFISIGKYMEQRTMSRTGQAIKALLNLQVKKARKLNGEEIPIEEVQKGDLLLVKPGEKIPLDGIISSGTAHIDESMITGESLPISKTEGETVIGSTLLLDSPLTIETIATGEETYLSKIIAVVEKAQNSKPQIQHKVDSIMKVFIPIVLGVAVVSTVLWLLVGPRFLDTQTVIRYAIQAFV
ncbi:MAG: HAD-IC family P-type ATPase [Candidatus Peribacteria bacterium]|jgi:cation transport ATPase|nr:HAD-IC family P-type ATPase [Candidatus Peribacteria bacterium]